MLNSLKQTGQTFGREISRAWDTLSEGWRELLSRSSDALTHFGHAKDETQPENCVRATYPRWSLLAGEVEETASDIVVRIELPGMDKGDCHIKIEGNTLYLSGEKHIERATHNSTYHVMERAYGAFERAIPLPRQVNPDKAEARFKNGVLTVRLPKEGTDRGTTLSVG